MFERPSAMGTLASRRSRSIRRLADLAGLALALLSPAAVAQEPDPALVERGLGVFRDTAFCAFCHSWHGKGERVEGLGYGADLTKMEMDREGAYEVIRCGRPLTFMPRHGRQAWNEGNECFDLNKDEIGEDIPNLPEGPFLRDAQIEAVVEYIFAVYAGKEMTFETCSAYYKSETERICEEYRK